LTLNKKTSANEGKNRRGLSGNSGKQLAMLIKWLQGVKGNACLLPDRQARAGHSVNGEYQQDSQGGDDLSVQADRAAQQFVRRGI